MTTKAWKNSDEIYREIFEFETTNFRQPRLLKIHPKDERLSNQLQKDYGFNNGS